MEIGQGIRQGDVLFRRIKELPAGAKLVPVDGGQIVVEYGEATGHAHVVDASDAQLYNVVSEVGEIIGQYLRVLEDTPLGHDEHLAIPLTPSILERWYQVEDDGEEERQVTD